MSLTNFQEHAIINTQIKVVKGTIAGEENTLGPDYNLFYWANFVPHFNAGHYFIIGECGFDLVCEKSKFFFEYVEETDTVTVKDYRLTTCEPEVSARYNLHIQYGRPRDDDVLVIPWKRFPRTKDGVSVPQLIERIFGRIPRIMLFL
jgi:hypothetical protein